MTLEEFRQTIYPQLRAHDPTLVMMLKHRLRFFCLYYYGRLLWTLLLFNLAGILAIGWLADGWLFYALQATWLAAYLIGSSVFTRFALATCERPKDN